jgi:hypothetical protein
MVMSYLNNTQRLKRKIKEVSKGNGIISARALYPARAETDSEANGANNYSVARAFLLVRIEASTRLHSPLI